MSEEKDWERLYRFFSAYCWMSMGALCALGYVGLALIPGAFLLVVGDTPDHKIDEPEDQLDIPQLNADRHLLEEGVRFIGERTLNGPALILWGHKVREHLRDE